MAKIKVRTAPGILKYPREESAKRYITAEPVEVDSSAYYRRAINSGDLLQVNSEPAQTQQPTKTLKKAQSNE